MSSLSAEARMLGLLLTASGALTSPSPLRVAVCGAGPAGLTFARAMQQMIPSERAVVTVYEQAPEVRPAVGGGLQLSSGAAVLARLGLGEALAKQALPLRTVLSRRAEGSEVLRLDVQSAMREAGAELLGADGAYAIMRDALQQLLSESVAPGTLQLDRSLRDYRAGVCTFVDAAGVEHEAAADLLIGADGIGSMVKTLAFPPSAPPAYSGVKVIFCVGAPGAALRPAGSDGAFHQWLGDGAYCLSASYGSAAAGVTQEMLALCYADADPGVENQAWEDNGALRSAFESRLRAARMPAELGAFASAAERFYETAVYYRNPSPGWSVGESAVLIGDAAHAMPPFLGQGANQALCDAYCLAARLAGELGGATPASADVRRALKEYEGSRFWPTTRLLLNSRFLGALETQAGAGAAARDAFFFGTGKLGVAKAVFLDGAMPRGL